jgi:hypothetical protein
MHYAAEETEALANPKTTISTNYNTLKKTSKLIKANCKETCKLMKASMQQKKKGCNINKTFFTNKMPRQQTNNNNNNNKMYKLET